ncbi:MAG: HAMP domain-containing sensor histidine kinase [Eubacteriales bacterium]|nr:HAMP domain-containing sensor histidine kinase [Eubacteriales bacterium]MDY3332470.1 HAMP domain-containing sensor histidine kinase [Gallibacter sp.]
MHFLRNDEVRKGAFWLGIVILASMGIAIEIGATTVILISITSTFFVVLFIQFSKVRYNKLEKLTQTVDRILNSDDIVVFGSLEEGDFSIIENEIRKMTIKIREGENRLQKEKIHLTDSIADISHQLRTPLTTINLLMDKMKRTDIDEMDRRRLMSDINNQLSRIEWLISSLLKISKFDADTVEMNSEKISVAELIAKSVEPMMIPLEIRDQFLEYISLGNETYVGDLNWSVEAVSNIIKNCVEHTQEGGSIKISARENVLFTAIEIEDNGTGIDEKDLPHIFERFYRGKNSNIASIGIGLALSKMIIQRQNGVIKAENKKDGGSKFTIKFYKGELDGSVAS